MEPINPNAINISSAPSAIPTPTKAVNSGPTQNATAHAMGPTSCEKIVAGAAVVTGGTGVVSVKKQVQHSKATEARENALAIIKIRTECEKGRIAVETAIESFRDLNVGKVGILKHLERARKINNYKNYILENDNARYVLKRSADKGSLDKTSHPELMREVNLAGKSISKSKEATQDLPNKFPSEQQEYAESEINKTLESCKKGEEQVENVQIELSGYPVTESQADSVAEKVTEVIKTAETIQAQQENCTTSLTQEELPCLPPLPKGPRRGRYGSITESFLHIGSETMSGGSSSLRGLSEEICMATPEYKIGLTPQGTALPKPQTSINTSFPPSAIILFSISFVLAVSAFIMRSQRLKREEKLFVGVLYRYASNRLSFLEAKRILIEDFNFTENHALEILQKI